MSADTLLERSRRLSNLQGAELGPHCCAIAPAARSAPSQPILAVNDTESDRFEILFHAGSTEVDPSAERAIHALADYLILHPEIRKAELWGYADIHGTAESNDQLAARRAEAVKRVLSRHSVAPDRLVTRSHGATAPVASSTTANGMRLNRRVVIRIIDPAAASKGAEKVTP